MLKLLGSRAFRPRWHGRVPAWWVILAVAQAAGALEPPRVALVAPAASGAHIVDVLTAELTKERGIALVERDLAALPDVVVLDRSAPEAARRARDIQRAARQDAERSLELHAGRSRLAPAGWTP